MIVTNAPAAHQLLTAIRNNEAEIRPTTRTCTCGSTLLIVVLTVDSKRIYKDLCPSCTK